MKSRSVSAKRSSKRALVAAGQIDFFEVLDRPASVVEIQNKPDLPKARAAEALVSAKRTSLQRTANTARKITEADIPAHDPDEAALVDASLAELPSRQQWFTYSDIQRSFGISRATIARKVKAGLVPGIRFDGDRVVEEGAVRRFSRDQVRFVLLAVRRRDWKSVAF